MTEPRPIPDLADRAKGRPPPWLAETPAAPLVELWNDLRQRRADAETRYHELIAEGGAEARRADVAAAAEAMRAGEPAPGQPATARYRERIDEVFQQAEVLGVLIEEAHDDLQIALNSEEFDEWLRAQAAELADARARALEQLTALTASLAVVDNLAGLDAWAHERRLGGPHGIRHRVRNIGVSLMVYDPSIGEQTVRMDLQSVVGSIRDAIEATTVEHLPEPKPAQPKNARPKRAPARS